MDSPSISDILTELESTGAVSKKDRDLYEKNYQYFVDNKSRIRPPETAEEQWAGSIDNEILVSSSLSDLEKQISHFANHRYAYIEQLQ